MDDVSRSRRVVLSTSGRRADARATRLARVLAALAAGACAAAGACRAQESNGIGLSPPRAFEHVARRHVDATDGGVPSPVPGDFRSTFTQLGDRFLSHGHADQFDAVLRANDAARAAWTAGAVAADGAMFVEDAIDVASSGSADGGVSGLLVMEKRAGSWVFAVVSLDDEVVADERVSACAGCHRDAPRDFVFRTPAAKVIRPAPADVDARDARDAASE